MVGDQGDRGRGAAPAASGVRAAYDHAASGWTSGPGQVYGPLASALVACAPVPVAQGQVLDLGSGTGLAGRAALAAGARRVVAADLAMRMLRHCGPPLRPVAADAAMLPFRDASFDLVLAAFSLSHLPRLADGLTEARRVGRALAASSFAPGWGHPARDAVDDVLRPLGYQPPPWYGSLRAHDGSCPAEDPAVLAAEAGAAGYGHVTLHTIDVATGLSTPAELASWRLGMAHLAPFVHSLDSAGRAAARRAAERAIAHAVGASAPLVVRMLVLAAR